MPFIATVSRPRNVQSGFQNGDRKQASNFSDITVPSKIQVEGGGGYDVASSSIPYVLQYLDGSSANVLPRVGSICGLPTHALIPNWDRHPIYSTCDGEIDPTDDDGALSCRDGPEPDNMVGSSFQLPPILFELSAATHGADLDDDDDAAHSQSQPAYCVTSNKTRGVEAAPSAISLAWQAEVDVVLDAHIDEKKRHNNITNDAVAPISSIYRKPTTVEVSSYTPIANFAGYEGERERATVPRAVTKGLKATGGDVNNSSSKTSALLTSIATETDTAALKDPPPHRHLPLLFQSSPSSSTLSQYADRHLFPFVTFLRDHHAIAHLLLKTARKSKLLLKNSDLRFIALYLLQTHIAANPDVKGARHQAVLVATALFLAAKFCDQNALIRHVLVETGLGMHSTVSPRDVYDTEWPMLEACGYQIQIPRYWQSACEVAFSTPHDGLGGVAEAGGCSMSVSTRLRVSHTSLYMDRQLVELSRNETLQIAVLQMNADELAFGCSVAVAASMATPTEATVALFDSIVVAPLNINFQTLQAEALHEYVKCLGHLAGLLRTEVGF